MNRLISLSIILFCSVGFAKATIIKTKKMQDVFSHVKKLIKNNNVNDILVAFDIDDTLLVTDPCKVGGVLIRGFKKLIICPADPTEKTLAKKIIKLQDLGVHTLALTARSNFLLRKTQKELTRNNFDFKGSPFKKDLELKVPKKCRPNRILPCKKFKTLPFKKGVVYASGTNKGKVLHQLLTKLNATYKQIIFIDDRQKNIDDIFTVFENENSNTTLFHYLKHRPDEN